MKNPALAAALWGALLCAPAALRADDLPKGGRSLFDHLTTTMLGGQSVQRVPYPFPALLDAIRAHAAADGLGRDGVAAVLIPLGRSLQRNASAGDYFRHPRVVVAVTGEARAGAAQRMLLKDRLFLGYQDEAGVIEVISYNEHAGRFEFQVVTDYRPGGTPRVAYARRAVCVTCHHAAAPIFSRPGWDETNANPAVAQALSAHAERFHGVAVRRGIDVPNAIDDAVARAGRLALAQTLWRHGCDAVGPDADAVACRQALLLAALERRLGMTRPVAQPLAGVPALAALAAAWRTSWPQGLPEPDPNIPNRDPFFGRAQQLGALGTAIPWGAEEIVPALDPMSPRAPATLWRADASGMDALLHTLGTFFAQADVRLIEAALAAADRPGRQRPAARSTSAPGAHTTAAHEPAAPPRSGQTLAGAIAALAAETRAGQGDALASRPFRRAAVLQPLLTHLGVRATLACCDQGQPGFPAAAAESEPAQVPADLPPALAPFYRHCAACHASPSASPPGFLYGDIALVERNLQRCAARIDYRLSMWQQPARLRTKVPMPPPLFVPAWEQAAPRADIERMRAYAARSLGTPERTPGRGYEALPPCRVSASGSRAMPAH